MDFGLHLCCDDCKHHTKSSCARIEYKYHRPIGKFWFCYPQWMSAPRGHICNKFELVDFYYHSPSYSDFTLDKYIIYRGIERMEWRVLTATGFSCRTTCDGEYTFEFLRNQTREGIKLGTNEYGYKIWHGKDLIKYYKCLEFDLAFADWLDICCGCVKHTAEYIEDAKQAFVKGGISLYVRGYKEFHEWFRMRYKDWFYGDLFSEDGKLKVYKHKKLKLPKNYDTYITVSEDIDGLVVN